MKSRDSYRNDPSIGIFIEMKGSATTNYSFTSKSVWESHPPHHCLVPPPWLLGGLFGVVFGVCWLFGGVFGVLLVLFWYCIATVQLLNGLIGRGVVLVVFFAGHNVVDVIGNETGDNST